MTTPPTDFAPKRQAVLLGLVAGLLCVGLTAGVYEFTRQAGERSLRDDIERQAQNRLINLQSAVQNYEVRLDTLRSLFEYSAVVSREEFRGISRKVLAGRPALQAVEWLPLVPGGERAAFEAAARAEGLADFVIRDRAGTEYRFVPAAERPDYLPVFYTEPFETNRPALGFNVQSGIVAAHVRRARETGRTVMTQRTRLFDPKGLAEGFITYLPVYDPPGDTARGRFRGMIVGVFRLDLFFADAPRPDQGAEHVDLLVVDRTADTPGVMCYLPAGRPTVVTDLPEESAFTGPYALEIPLRVWERNWGLRFRPCEAWFQTRLRASRPSLLIVLLGLFASGAVGLFVYGRLRRTSLIETQVTSRTAELRLARQLLEEDIRRRTQAEDALRASEANLQAILDHSPNAIFVKDLAGRYMLVNRQYTQMWNRPAAAIIGRTDEELFPTEAAARHRDTDRRTLAASAVIRFDATVSLPGRPTPVTSIVHKAPLRDADGRVYGVCGISTDITERIQAEAELSENRRQLSNLISQLPGAAFRCLFDDKLTALFASEGMELLTGHPPADFTEGRIHIAGLTVPADRPAVRQAVGAAIRDRRPFEVEYRLLHRDGKERWVLVRGRPIHDEAGTLRFLEGLAIDVTALKQAEADKISIERKLLEAQKLESLGVLAGGIAHDFNNILTSVLGNASLARHEVPTGSPVARSLDQIEQAARRAADLCQQMLAYAGKGRLVTDRVNLSELVRGTTALLEVSIGKNTRLDLRLADRLPSVLADITQLRQIVMNLVINAADAIGTSPGHITITTFARTADAGLLHNALGHPDLLPGIYAGLEVTDNGSGMTPETIARIFEPFFTTKFSGRGLGLSAVLGIVQSHRGALFVESQPGGGSTFRLLLPTTDGEAPASAAPFEVPADRPALRGTVLVIDDDDSIRQVTATVLQSYGAEVLTAANGLEGIRLLENPAQKISLILLDLTMPGLSGDETLDRMRQNGARQPVILMSGYSESEAMQRSASLGIAGFIQKPFELETLVARIKPFLT